MSLESSVMPNGIQKTIDTGNDQDEGGEANIDICGSPTGELCGEKIFLNPSGNILNDS